MNSSLPIRPEKIMQYANGHLASAYLAAGAIHNVFGHIERGARTVEEIALRASISPRGAQALLDGCGVSGWCGGWTACTQTARRRRPSWSKASPAACCRWRR